MEEKVSESVGVHSPLSSDFKMRRELFVNNFSNPIVRDGSTYEFEKFNYPYWREWMQHHWHWSLYFAAIYVALIFIGRKVMKNREPSQFMGRLLIYWNLALAIFSIFAFSRAVPELIFIMGQNNGFHLSVCTRDYMTLPHVFWEWMGTLSKVAELFDTAFVVLRKQNLIFLHWYHHATVMIYTWFSIGDQDPVHRWFMCMNYFVHSIMYSYYFLRAYGMKLPRNLAMLITSLQLLQMVVGVTINVYSLYVMNAGVDCARKPLNIFLALGMYFSYMILFANFFRSVYFGKEGRYAKKTIKAKSS